MALAGLASRQDLLNWADTTGSRSELPRLVRRLILETGDGVERIDFPADEGTAAGGWDGISVADGSTVHVPEGLGLWELSVNDGAQGKAEEDYGKRTETPDGSPTEEATYVQLILRPWTKRNEWQRESKEDKRWRDVRAYGVDDVAIWLETAPATHAWFSELLGLTPAGIRSAEGWWRRWSARTKPAFSTALLLAGREEAGEALRRELAGGPSITTVDAGSPDEALGLIAASILSGDSERDAAFASRTVFVDRVDSWRELARSEGPMILVAASQEVIPEAEAAGRHNVVVPTVGARSADITFPAVNAAAFTEALEALELAHEEAYSLARLARRSLPALRRRLATKPELNEPAWARDPVERVVRGALLAFSWHGGAEGDRAVLAELAGLDYDELKEKLKTLSTGEDPFLIEIGQSWTVVSPLDAFQQLGASLDDDDLSRFATLAEAVLLEEDPASELPRSERWWRAGVERKVRKHSGDLRRGMVNTLALLGTEGEIVADGRGTLVADRVVARLLESANEDASGERWAALSPHLPLLAEASPDSFLAGVRAACRGDEPLARTFFTDHGEDYDPMFGPDSPHTGLLWALETTAWSPDHLAEASYLLAFLTELDPGGRLANRPREALGSIFCLWHPDTGADAGERLEVLDELRTRHPDPSWKLMLSLLPESHAIHMPSYSPTYRDWKPTEAGVTTQEWLEASAELVTRLIADAGSDAGRWQALLEHSTDLAPADRARVREALSGVVSTETIDPEGGRALWESMRELAARHREFTHTDWALPDEEVDEIERISTALKPQREAELHSWVFEDHMPNLGTGAKRKDGEYDHAGFTEALSDARREAVEQVLEGDGLDGVLEMVERAVVPGSVGFALAEVAGDRFDLEARDLLLSGNENQTTFASGYLTRRFAEGGWDWLEALIASEGAGEKSTGILLLLSGDYPKAWQRAEEIGEGVAREFWTRFSPFGLGSDYPEVADTAEKLLWVGRPAAALQILHLYGIREEGSGDPDLTGLVMKALEGLFDGGQPEGHEMSEYEFGRIFAYLEEHREAVDEKALGLLEWRYLPALGMDPSVPTLEAALAENPSFFVEVISAVFRPRSADAVEQTPEQEAVATNAYRLLSSWREVPGLDREANEFDDEALAAWVEEAIERLKEADRLESGELQIGRMLASAPPGEDGITPPPAVRVLLEKLQSEQVEEGLRVALHNARGVTSRDPEGGGEQEWELAEKYTKDAASVRTKAPRTAAILRDLAKSYEGQAREFDARAERLRKGLER